jgi:hypothetical protein
MIMKHTFTYLTELITVLKTARNNPEERTAAIDSFQECMYDSDSPLADMSQEQWEILWLLAYDLDYYEPNPKMRREDPSFYGEERLLQEIDEALKKLGFS